jgi:hypothetical protein
VAGQFVTRTQAAVSDAIVGPDFGGTSVALGRYHDLSGTYDGASVGAHSMALKWGNDRSYCIEGVSQTHGTQHLLGPNGLVAAGPCPAWGF